MIHDLIEKIIPTYSCTLPVCKKTITFRPLLVKEEKFIAQINELSTTFSEKLRCLTELVNSCCKGLNSGAMYVYDFQYLLTEIRRKSIDEKSFIQIRCPHTGELVSVEINFDEILKNVVDLNDNIEVFVNDTTKLVVKLPRINDLLKTNCNFESEDDLVKVLPYCLYDLETESGTIALSAESVETRNEVVESLSRKNYKEIKEKIRQSLFIMKLKYHTEDGTERQVEVTDFINFLRFYLATLI